MVSLLQVKSITSKPLLIIVFRPGVTPVPPRRELPRQPGLSYLALRKLSDWEDPSPGKDRSSGNVTEAAPRSSRTSPFRLFLLAAWFSHVATIILRPYGLAAAGDFLATQHVMCHFWLTLTSRAKFSGTSQGIKWRGSFQGRDIYFSPSDRWWSPVSKKGTEEVLVVDIFVLAFTCMPSRDPWRH